MDQLRHLIYHRPVKKHPWDPFRSRPGVDGGEVQSSETSSSATPTDPSRTGTPLSDSVSSPTQRFLEVEIKHSPERGHPNICKLLDFFEDREFYYLVMPRFGTGVDLFDRVESQAAGLEPFEVRSLLGQLTDAVRFLHANGIVHRDIKDENVILDGDGRCQLIDFGSAAHWRPGKRWDTFSGTLHYASPEIMRGEMYTGKEQDIWALGTVAYVLLVGETPFAELPDDVLAGIEPGSRALEALDARCDGDAADEGREPDGGGALGDAADFVHRCLEQDLANRPTADNLLTHKFLIGYGGWTGRRGWIKPKPKPGLSA
jgi:serine/threonine protein kinase